MKQEPEGSATTASVQTSTLLGSQTSTSATYQQEASRQELDAAAWAGFSGTVQQQLDTVQDDTTAQQARFHS